MFVAMSIISEVMTHTKAFLASDVSSNLYMIRYLAMIRHKDRGFDGVNLKLPTGSLK